MIKKRLVANIPLEYSSRARLFLNKIPPQICPVFVWSMLIVSVVGIFRVSFLAHPILDLKHLTLREIFGAFAFYGIVVIPSHELGHSLSALSYGAYVKEAGIKLSSLYAPIAYVKVVGTHSTTPLQKANIAAAGIISDICWVGCIAWFMIVSHPKTCNSWILVLLLIILALMKNAFPAGNSDGGRISENTFAVLELACKSSTDRGHWLSLNPRKIRELSLAVYILLYLAFSVSTLIWVSHFVLRGLLKV